MSLLARALTLAVIGTAFGLGGCSSGGGGGGAAAAPPATAGVGVQPAQLAPTKSKAPVVVARAGEGFLESNQGKLFLHVKGAPTEMGLQYGELVGGHIEAVLQRLPAFMAANNFPAQILPAVSASASGLFGQWFPPDLVEYMDGIVAGNRRRNPQSSLGRDDLIFLSSLVDLGGISSGLITCSSVAVWGERARDGKMFQTRNVDLFIGSGLEDHALVVIEKRDGRTPWANAGWTGMLGGVSGLSAHGIGIGQIWAFSADKAFGRPWGLTTRRIMEDGENCDDAVRELALERLRTYGSNFVFGDKGDGRGGAPRACAIESSANYMATFGDNDAREDLALWQGNPYAIKIPWAVFRGDCCLDPGMRSRQNGGSGGPSGDPRPENAYVRRYKGQADRVLAYQAAGTKIGAPELIALTQGVATPGGSLQCCVYANSDLEMWVADARIVPGSSTRDAFQEPYAHYDLDYYLPTVEVTLDKASYIPGEQQHIEIETRTMGSDRDLWLSLAIEGPGGATATYAGLPAPMPVAFRRGAAPRDALELNLPAPLPAGPYRLVATLTERGTADVVDIAVAPFTVN